MNGQRQFLQCLVIINKTLKWMITELLQIVTIRQLLLSENKQKFRMSDCRIVTIYNNTAIALSKVLFIITKPWRNCLLPVWFRLFQNSTINYGFHKFQSMLMKVMAKGEVSNIAVTLLALKQILLFKNRIFFQEFPPIFEDCFVRPFSLGRWQEFEGHPAAFARNVR
jgi:hypothetical protein